MAQSKLPNIPTKRRLSAILQPKNLLKTVGSQIPIASAGIEILNQWESVETEERICSVEDEVATLKKLREAERAVPAEKPPLQSEWPLAVGEYNRRSVEFVVVETRPEKPDDEFVIPLVHGCIIGDGRVLTTRAALQRAQALARKRKGHLIIMHGMAGWYDFSIEDEDDKNGSGLILCKLGKRDEAKFKEATSNPLMRENVDWFPGPPTDLLNTTLKPWLGQEVGWLVSSEAHDIMRGAELTGLEFQSSVIAHFRRPSDEALKRFVTSVMPSTLICVGSAAFSKDGTLLGTIGSLDRYEHDNGFRINVHSLLGHPYFMNLHMPRRVDAQNQKTAE